MDMTAYLHYGVKGDWVLQTPSDLTDTYRVAEKFFNSTYDKQPITSAKPANM